MAISQINKTIQNIHKSRLSRLFDLLDTIKAEPRHWTSGRLSIKYQISKKQIKKDIADLRLAGFKIQGSQKGYFVLDNESKR